MQSPRLSLFPLAMSLLLCGTTAQAEFDFSTVLQEAETLASKPFEPPAPVPELLVNLPYDQFQSIRFRPDQSLWRGDGSKFQIMFFHPGLYFRNAVDVLVVDDNGVEPLGFEKSWFDYPPKLAQEVPNDAGYAGINLTYPLTAPDVQNQFLVFAGASYFRGVGRDESFGLSGRGLALNTGLPVGEEFPLFRRFWLVKPALDADQMTFYALLDSKSVTGAYRFVVTPGEPTVMSVEATLFFRKAVEQVGLAPLTSMFFYGENTDRPTAHWRPEVHDSDGLAIETGTGEHIWRPITNPKRLSHSYFGVTNPRGFGLIQRDRRFASYEDPEANYQNRPNAWVVPKGDWGEGSVTLVEIPTDKETNDNVVAFWTPKEKVQPGSRITLAYDVLLGGPATPPSIGGFVSGTYVGAGDVVGGGNVEGAVRVLADFTGGDLPNLPDNAPVTAVVNVNDGAELIHQTVFPVPQNKGWRLSLLVKPPKDKPLELRAFLRKDNTSLTETWTYRVEAP
jgi:periplasmic glucans biosynthesis protein